MSNLPEDYKVKVIKTVENNLIDIEKVCDRIEIYLEAGNHSIFHLSAENLEDIHISLGDDLFYDYLISLDTITDKEGLKYIKTFSETYEPTKKEDRHTKITEIDRKLSRELDDKINTFLGRYNDLPEYIIMSQKSFNLLEREAVDEWRYTTLVDSEGFAQYKGISIALIPAKQEHFVQFVVKPEKSIPAVRNRPIPKLDPKGTFPWKTTI